MGKTPQLASLGLGLLLKQAGERRAANKLREAAPLCMEILRRKPEHPKALLLLGSMALQTGDTPVATGFLRRAVAADRNSSTAWMELGDALTDSAPDEAAAAFRTAIAADGKNIGAHNRLGALLLGMGQRDEAAECFARARKLDPGDELSGYMLAELRGEAGPDKAKYVTGLFDSYAPFFEEHLTGRLRYDAPTRLAAALQAARPDGFAAALDLGCGTGLMAMALGPMVAAIDGVDLSPRMVETSRAKGLYRELWTGDLLDVLRRSLSKYDLVVAADVFIYVGALEAIFPAVREALKPGGLFGFSLEHAEGTGYELRGSARFAHSESYIAKLASGFTPVSSEPIALRQERSGSIAGRIQVLRRDG